MTSLIGRNVVKSYQEKKYISIPAKYKKSAPYSIGAIAKMKHGAAGLASSIYKQASLVGRLILVCYTIISSDHSQQLCTVLYVVLYISSWNQLSMSVEMAREMTRSIEI